MAGEAILRDLKQHQSDLTNIVEKEYSDYGLKIKRKNISNNKISYKVCFINDPTETADGLIFIVLNKNVPVFGTFNIGGVTGKVNFK